MCLVCLCIAVFEPFGHAQVAKKFFQCICVMRMFDAIIRIFNDSYIAKNNFTDRIRTFRPLVCHSNAVGLCYELIRPVTAWRAWKSLQLIWSLSDFRSHIFSDWIQFRLRQQMVQTLNFPRFVSRTEPLRVLNVQRFPLESGYLF